MILASNTNDLSPHFLPIIESKMGQYPPKMGKMGYIPSKLGQKQGGGGDEEFVLFIHI